MKQICTRFLSLLLVCLMVCGLGVFASAETAVAGDFNGDGECTVLDVLLVLKSLLNETELDGADMNGDGKVSLVDVFRVMRLAISGEAPEVGNPESGTADITVENGTTTDAVSLSGENVSAAVPAGVAVEEGATALTLTVTAMDDTNGNITPGETENAVSYDVHIDGVSEANTVPIIVDLGAILPVGQNTGTVTLYHIEDGVANKMTQVMTLAALDAHNEFYYYPATGNVFVALATFSEIALVADTVNAWEGEFDYSWYTEAIAENPDETNFTIANADQLAAFGAIVGGMNGQTQDSFTGKTVKLVADINLGDAEADNTNLIFYPIGYYNSEGTYEKTGTAITSGFKTFEGTFDGAGHTISNFYQNTWEMKGDNSHYDATLQYYNDGMGLFGKVYGGTVKNLTVTNFSSDGEFTTTGCIAAYADCGATFENIAITNCNPRVYNIGNGGIVGCVGWYTEAATDKQVTFTNITVDNSNKISALWGSWDVACGGLVGQYYPTSGQSSAGNPKNAGISFDNCHVAAQIDVYNDVCANYQYYAYRYAGMMIGSIRENTTNEDGHVYPDMTGITANDCTVHFGDWNDYYYCELVANSIASYTHDYQFSRLEQVDSVDTTNKTITVDGETTAIPDSGRYNYVVVNGEHATENATCYHFVNGEIWNHETAGTETVDGVEVLIENNQHIYLEFNQLFTGYGWGVTSKGLTDFAGIENMDITAGENDESVVKFAVIENAGTTYTTGDSVTAGALFAAIDGLNESVAIKDANVTVSLSPIGESSANGTAARPDGAQSWEEIVITFSGVGTASITIQDYYFCTPTTITVTVVEPTSVDKFAALNPTFTHTIEGGEIVATLGEIFEANENVTIDSSAVVVTATGCEYAQDTEDWTKSTLTFTGTGEFTVTITDNNLCNLATATVTVTEPEVSDKFAVVFPNTESYLYRVGNKNTVTLGTLFKETGNGIPVGTVSIAIETLAGNATGSYTNNDTWTSGTIQFAGTGVVKVTIDDNAYSNELTLNLEVVDATNVTSASFSGNTVLLADVSTSSTLGTSGVVYGNGFTVNMENAPITEKNGAVFHLYDGAILKNLSIVGKEFTTVAATVNDTNYGVSAVRAWGTAIIENCYISGCRAAVSVTGTELTIKDSVIANGVYANIDFRSGILNLHNVTTINEPHTVDSTTVLGLGIVGNMTASAGRKLNITGSLTQYNWVSQADCDNIKASGVDSIFDSVFTEDKYAALRYTYNGTTYVNTGILSLCSDFGASAVSGTPANYSGMDVTASISGVTVDGYVWAPAEANTLTDADMAYHDTVYAWTPDNQGTSFVAPAFNFSGVDLTVESGVVQIAYESGSSFTLSADTISALLPATKYGTALSYKVSMGGVDYTGKDIIFDATASQTYTVTYTITDNLIYDKTGALTDTTYAITKELKVFATVTDKTADAPVFTFYYGTNGLASAGTPHTTQPTNTYASTIKQVGEVYYIMPNVSATTENAIGSQTIDSETVYYPIVDGINVRSGNSTDYDFTRYYPIFKAVKISDNGTEYTYSGTTEIPDTVAWVEATIDSGNGASALNDDFGLYNNQYLCKIQTKAGNAESGGTSVVKFSYTALDGNTYYYYVGYRFYDEDEGGACVTPDTLVTLADGTQKRIDEVTYEDQLLVWDFVNGEYTAMPSIVVRNHGWSTYRVLTLNFNDGTSVNVIQEHGFFDVIANEFVMIKEENVTDYVGREFIKADGDFTTVILEDYSITEEYTAAYSILTAVHYNCILGDMFTLTPNVIGGNYFMPFEVGSDMKFDAEKRQADIEKYGLFTYEEFAHLVTEEQFYALNAPQVKVAVGKGIITMEDLMQIIDTLIPKETN